MLLFTLLFLGLAVAAGVYWIPRLVETKLEPWRAKEALANADRLWADSDKISAIRGYKSFLTTSPKILSAEFGPELDRLFRRVIEFEVNYGSKPEAIDWVERALYLKCEPYFESEECRKLWLDVKNQKSLKD